MAIGLLLPAIVLALVLAQARVARSHDAGEPYADWYNSLTRDEGGNRMGCCGAHHDCFAIGADDYRASQQPGYDYEVHLDAKWVPVPRASLLRRVDNPTGLPVVCVGVFDWIRCLVLPAEG